MNTEKNNAIWRDKDRRYYLVALIEESQNRQTFMIQTTQGGKKKMIASLNEAILMIITSPGQEVFPLQ